MAAHTERIHNISVLYLNHQTENELEDTFEK